MSTNRGKPGSKPSVRVISRIEVAKHNKPDDCWIIIHGKVFDVTKYLPEHPGGGDIVFKRAGRDATSDFDAMYHSPRATEVLRTLYVGEVQGSAAATTLSPFGRGISGIKSASAPSNKGGPYGLGVYKPRGERSGPYGLGPYKPSKNSRKIQFKGKSKAMSKLEFIPYRVLAMRQVSPDTKVYRFEVPEQGTVVIPPGKHIVVGLREGKTLVKREYTPITSQTGYFELMVKKYENGPMSTHIHSLLPGDMLLIRGPSGRYTYKPQKQKKLLMFAAGTGIAPMYQIIKEIAKKDNTDDTDTILIYASKTKEDILLKKDLDAMSMYMSRESKATLKIHYLLSREKEDWPLKGRITCDLVKKLVPLDDLQSCTTFSLICGTDGFCESAINILKELEYDDTRYFKF